jgi:hypothetical protein
MLLDGWCPRNKLLINSDIDPIVVRIVKDTKSCLWQPSYSLSNGQQCAKSLLSPVSHISGTHSYSLSNGHQCKKTNCLVLHSPIDDNHSYYFINGHKCTSSSLSPALPLSWQSLILVHQCTKSLLNPAFPLLTTTHTIWAMATNVTSFCQVLHSHMNGNHVTNTKGGGINKLV